MKGITGLDLETTVLDLGSGKMLSKCSVSFTGKTSTDDSLNLIDSNVKMYSLLKLLALA